MLTVQVVIGRFSRIRMLNPLKLLRLPKSFFSGMASSHALETILCYHQLPNLTKDSIVAHSPQCLCAVDRHNIHRDLYNAAFYPAAPSRCCKGGAHGG